jgi:hypothetical protein
MIAALQARVALAALEALQVAPEALQAALAEALQAALAEALQVAPEALQVVAVNN